MLTFPKKRKRKALLEEEINLENRVGEKDRKSDSTVCSPKTQLRGISKAVVLVSSCL